MPVLVGNDDVVEKLVVEEGQQFHSRLLVLVVFEFDVDALGEFLAVDPVDSHHLLDVHRKEFVLLGFFQGGHLSGDCEKFLLVDPEEIPVNL